MQNSEILSLSACRYFTAADSAGRLWWHVAALRQVIVGRMEDVAKLRQVIVGGRRGLAGLRWGITVCDGWPLCCGAKYQFVMARCRLAASNYATLIRCLGPARRDCMGKIENRRKETGFCEKNWKKNLKVAEFLLIFAAALSRSHKIMVCTPVRWNDERTGNEKKIERRW